MVILNKFTNVDISFYAMIHFPPHIIEIFVK